MRRVVGVLIALGLMSLVHAPSADADRARLREGIQRLDVARETNLGYHTGRFRHWVDANSDCQTARSEVLAQESRVSVRGCTVLRGRWSSYYDRKVWRNAGDVAIDHVVALKEAWASGAKRWTPETRERYANDLVDHRTLAAVTDNVDRVKASRDPAQWLPRFGKCRYVREVAAVKLRWGLTVDRAEKAKLLEVARGCSNTGLRWRRARVVLQETRPIPRGPNFVVILLDDMRADDFVAMPATDRLVGGRGARFDNAYSPFPLCCPARATLLTGQYAHNHGVLSNRAPDGGVEVFDPRHTIAVWLKRQGYSTAFVGKYLNGYAEVTARDYVPPGWTSWQGLAGNPHRYRSFSLNIDGRIRRYSDVYQTNVLGRRAVGVIERAGARPFLLVTSFLAPHAGAPVEEDDPVDGAGCFWTNLCWDATPAVDPRYANTWSGQPMPVTGAYGEPDVDDKPAHISALPAFTPERDYPALHQELHEQRLESIRSVDDQVRSVVRALADAGKLDNTYIVVTSDNGYMMGEHRIPFGKVHPYEPSTRIPMVMSGPDIPPGVHVPQLVGLHDLVPTVLRATGTYGAQTVPLDGMNLLPFTNSSAGASRDLLLEAGRADATDNESLRRSSPAAQPYRGIRTDTGWKYVEYNTGDVEMYNLNDDPDELENLAADPSFVDQRMLLDQALEQLSWCSGPACRRDTGP
jgi:N-acetylglucosamine-6-sulfatase